jgi:nucleotide-binding universal stress UspA family protein
MKILLAVDGSSYTKRMLGYLGAHDELFTASNQYTIITVQPPLPPHVARFLDKSMVQDYYRDQVNAVVDPVLAFAKQHGWQPEVLHPVGHAGDLIAETATDGKYDMVVLGSHGHSAIGGLAVGSVTTRVLARCSTPALIIR